MIRLQPPDVLDEVKRREDLFLRLQNQRRVRVSAGNLKEFKLLTQINITVIGVEISIETSWKNQ